MANLHRVRECLLLSHCLDIIDEHEFALLYDVNKPTNCDFRYYDYETFDLDDFNDNECNSYFRFQKNDLVRLKNALQVPDRVRCSNGTRMDGIEALCITLARFAYPCRYGDMQWLRPRHLDEYAQAISNKGAALTNCWGFVDGTVRPVCRPSQHQQVMYNGHKRLHALKFQSVTAANGMIAHLYGPIEGRRHDCYLLRMSGLLNELEEHSFNSAGGVMCIYGDPAYPLRTHLQAPFKGNLTPVQNEYNKSMSSVRISVEWLFGDIVNFFKFIDFKKSQKVWLSACGKMYAVCGLLTNAHTCLYGNNTSKFFGLEPPTLEEYFQTRN
ncbi:PREDICTED: uncharacterized protein LOC106814941 isoform X2 [Priapulus caudatus]|uniref:Uncharacterized protein LOC106814941 isoform X2 n=1 Tax=Priapulus caudatus TaxID=37621 RepID=A0ABM1ERJ7_PRICU|nr:PREDICTED: uncharacterized protein LOC106814941 isoform X2 [Priapulus caudatus]